MLADLVDVAIGVDTHKHTHKAAAHFGVGNAPPKNCLDSSGDRDSS